MKYRKKLIIINAMQWQGEPAGEVAATLGVSAGLLQDGTAGSLYIETLEGTMRPEVGDWILKGVEGEVYPCKDSVFRFTCEEVD